MKTLFFTFAVDNVKFHVLCFPHHSDGEHNHMSHPTDIHVGRKIRETRVLKGFSQEQLGSRLGVSFQQVQKYEKGTNRVGSSRLWDIAQILDQPISHFFDGLEGAPSSDMDCNRRQLIASGELAGIPEGEIKNKVYGLIRAISRDSQAPCPAE